MSPRSLRWTAVSVRSADGNKPYLVIRDFPGEAPAVAASYSASNQGAARGDRPGRVVKYRHLSTNRVEHAQ